MSSTQEFDPVGRELSYLTRRTKALISKIEETDDLKAVFLIKDSLEFLELKLSLLDSSKDHIEIIRTQIEYQKAIDKKRLEACVNSGTVEDVGV